MTEMATDRPSDLDRIAALMPKTLMDLAMQISACSPTVARRRIVSRVGSVRSGETFDDDLVDTIFLRLQARSQIGAYDDERVIMALGRDARRLEGDGMIVLYRAAPPGSVIRPGDFAADSKEETGFYRHGGNRTIEMTVPRTDVFTLRGACGDGQEYIYLPKDYERPEVLEFFPDFRSFHQFSKDFTELSQKRSQAALVETRPVPVPPSPARSRSPSP